MFRNGSARYYFLDGIAVVEVVGEESYDLLLDVHTRLAKDPQFIADMPKLLDDRRVTHFIGPKDLMNLQAEMKRVYPPSGKARRIATLSDDPTAEKFVRLYTDIRELGKNLDSLEHRYFAEFDEAVAWLKKGAK